MSIKISGDIYNPAHCISDCIVLSKCTPGDSDSVFIHFCPWFPYFIGNQSHTGRVKRIEGIIFFMFCLVPAKSSLLYVNFPGIVIILVLCRQQFSAAGYIIDGSIHNYLNPRNKSLCYGSCSTINILRCIANFMHFYTWQSKHREIFRCKYIRSMMSVSCLHRFHIAGVIIGYALFLVLCIGNNDSPRCNGCPGGRVCLSL